MIHVAEIRDAAELDGIRLLWRSLWQRTRNASFLQSFECFETWCRHFGQSQQIKVLVATLAARPIGILPLVIRRSETLVGEVRQLTYPATLADLGYGPIGPNTAATLVAVMRHLRESRRDWDVIDLPQLGVNQLDRGRTRNALRAAGMNHIAQAGRPAALVEFDRNWSSYWSTRPLESRRRFHQSERRLQQQGTLEFVRHRSQERNYGTGNSSCEKFERLAASTTAREFWRDIQAAAARHAAADLGLLKLDGRTIAAARGYAVDGRVDVLSIDALPEWEVDARRVLGAHLLQDGACRGDESYRFAPHLRPLAAEWGTDIIEMERLTHFAPTAPKAQLLRWNHGMQHWWGTLRRATAALNL